MKTPVSSETDVKAAMLESEPSIGHFSSAPRDFINSHASKLNMSNVELDDVTIDYLITKMEHGVTRFQILNALKRLQGDKVVDDAMQLRLEAARLAIPGQLLVYENLIGFAPQNNLAFVKHAFRQVLARAPSEPENVRLCHELETGALTRPTLLKRLDRMARMEGIDIKWDSFTDISSALEDSDGDLLTTSGLYGIDEQGRPTISLCNSGESGWSIGDGVDVTIIDAFDGRWRFNEGFFLKASPSRLPHGVWCVEMNIAQPGEGEIVLDVIANAGLSQLLSTRFRGSVSASFVFEKDTAHTFIQVRLRSINNKSISWAAVQRLRLVRLGDI